MKTIYRSLPLAIATSILLGCGGGSQTDTATTADPAADASAGGFVPQRPPHAYQDPRDTVRDFLTAVQNGDEKKATSLLTSAAQREAWENGLSISADGFPEARFDVSEVEYLKESSEAHVMSVWSDKSRTGEMKTFECVWLLRNEEKTWCIYGMATKVLESLAPIVLNFEDQSDVMKKQKWAEEQILKQRQAQQQPVQGPIQQAGRPPAGTSTR